VANIKDMKIGLKVVKFFRHKVNTSLMCHASNSPHTMYSVSMLGAFNFLFEMKFIEPILRYDFLSNNSHVFFIRYTFNLLYIKMNIKNKFENLQHSNVSKLGQEPRKLWMDEKCICWKSRDTL